ncbi:hypothetical protein [Psychromonas antarctica]|uniref:hypothetical protein n=1 Tax=Psychromonas antarctica TaxID=67573 RepID=UPI001EE7C69C|nr:hypothetical protein [Psychromonas antarctica]MCG6202626.1 hypothetical protein [Psychromonas antarctica]
MKKRFITVVTLATCLLGCSYFESEADQALRLSKTYQLEIKAGDPSLFYPEQFDKQPSNLKMEETSLEEASEALDGIEKALIIYPPDFVPTIIDAIYICGPMWMDGAVAGGTYGKKKLILSSISKWNGTKVNYNNALRAVHHELSSQIYTPSIFTRLAWSALMPPDWKSAVNNYDALMVNHDLPPDYNSGFLTQYGKTSTENDFNVYAEFAFAEPARLRLLAQQHPIIAKKLGLLISAYTNISPEFSDAFDSYFAKTGLSEVAINTEKAELTLHLDIDVDNLHPTISQE